MLEPVDKEQLRQGDVVQCLFCPILDKPQLDFIPTNAGKNARVKRNVAPDSNVGEDERAIIKVVGAPALILSQSCDLARGEFVLVAPLQPMGRVVSIRRPSANDEPQRVKWSDAEEHERQTERLRIASQEAYLGLYPVFRSGEFDVPEDLVADFRRSFSLAINKPEAKKYLLGHRRASLTHDARSVLQHKLANFFGRYAAADGWHETHASA